MRLGLGFNSSKARIEIDFDFLLDRPVSLLNDHGHLISDEELTFLNELTEQLKETLKPLSEYFQKGVVHGDFWWFNYHVQGDTLCFFDFDFCGKGWLIYDIASFLGTADGLHYDMRQELRSALMEGYEGIRSINAQERAAIQPLTLVRIIWGLGLWTTLIPMNGELWFKQSMDGTVNHVRHLWENPKN